MQCWFVSGVLFFNSNLIIAGSKWRSNLFLKSRYVSRESTKLHFVSHPPKTTCNFGDFFVCFCRYKLVCYLQLNRWWFCNWVGIELALRKPFVFQLCKLGFGSLIHVTFGLIPRQRIPKLASCWVDFSTFSYFIIIFSPFIRVNE